MVTVCSIPQVHFLIDPSAMMRTLSPCMTIKLNQTRGGDTGQGVAKTLGHRSRRQDP